MTEQDLYQQRYLAHQKRKREVLEGLLLARHSNRVFDPRPLHADDTVLVMKAIHTAPSSCARRGVTAAPYEERDAKAALAGLLVGGVGWLHRAPTVFLLIGDPAAYKAPGESSYMPYLDAGVAVGQALLAVTAAGMAGCYVNPNIRQAHRPAFELLFGDSIFCGALAVGYPVQP